MIISVFIYNQTILIQGCETDPYKAGYRGTCSPLSIDNQAVVESTWHLTSRIKYGNSVRKKYFTQSSDMSDFPHHVFFFLFYPIISPCVGF